MRREAVQHAFVHEPQHAVRVERPRRLRARRGHLRGVQGDHRERQARRVPEQPSHLRREREFAAAGARRGVGDASARLVRRDERRAQRCRDGRLLRRRRARLVHDPGVGRARASRRLEREVRQGSPRRRRRRRRRRRQSVASSSRVARRRRAVVQDPPRVHVFGPVFCVPRPAHHVLRGGEGWRRRALRVRAQRAGRGDARVGNSATARRVFPPGRAERGGAKRGRRENDGAVFMGDGAQSVRGFRVSVFHLRHH
mmetsp:Transcript_9309/g.39517  ORF Transcript_9309/g.39517 Transcript_9309/m.39517 type:complete len:255 (+) Transcript_9309:420-1184(+)